MKINKIIKNSCLASTIVSMLLLSGTAFAVASSITVHNNTGFKISIDAMGLAGLYQTHWYWDADDTCTINPWINTGSLVLKGYDDQSKTGTYTDLDNTEISCAYVNQQISCQSGDVLPSNLTVISG